LAQAVLADETRHLVPRKAFTTMGKNNKECKWCEQGECWSHGQIEKPDGGVKKVATKKSAAITKKSGGKVQGGKSAGKAQIIKGKGGNMQQQLMKQMANMKGGGKGKSFGKVQQQFVKQMANGRPEQNPKGDLGSALPLLLERSCTKEDCVYEVSEEGDKHVAVLQIAALSGGKTEFRGKPADNKKEAERNAAQKALNVLSKEIKVARAAHAAAKAEKEKARKEEKGDRVCKWCEQGECWDHGQIEKPEGVEKKAGAGGAQKKKKKN